jgi:hypothetical protein
MCVSQHFPWVYRATRCATCRGGRAFDRNGWGGEGARGAAHFEHAAHVRDAGCVPAERLVEGVRFLPRVASRAYEAGRAAGPRRGAAGGEQSRCAQRAGERVQLHCLGRLGLGAAHVKHAPHDRDEGGVPAQWLVEGERPLPRVAGHMVRQELERAGRRRGGGVCVRGARSVKEGGRLRGGARGAAHEKHAVHARHTGGVPAERLVEGRRVLPRAASRAESAGRAAAGTREAASERGVHVQRDAVERAQRTENMFFMSVTPDVSQPEMAALKLDIS